MDQLIKCYVKAGRVGDAVRLADVQLRGIADPLVRARVVLTVYPWRFGAAVWAGAARRHTELVAAAEAALALPDADADAAGLALTPHNALIFLPAELGAKAVARTVARTQPLEPLNGTWPRLRACAACRYRIGLRLGYLLWEVTATDVLYPLIAGILQVRVGPGRAGPGRAGGRTEFA